MVKPVLLFDSGIGARAVDIALKTRMPGLKTHIIQDTEGFPYGTKPSEWVENRVTRMVQEAVRQYTPQAVIVACNTASFCAGAKLVDAVSSAVHLTFPPFIEAVTYTATRSIALLVTPLTARHPAFLRRLNQIESGGVDVTLINDPHLALMAEDYITQRIMPDMTVLRAILLPIASQTRIDVCVLGCTHYGFIRPLMEQAIGREIAFLDSAETVAQRVAQSLVQTNQKMG